MIYYSERIGVKSSQGKGTWGKVQGRTRRKLPLAFPRGVLQTAVLPPCIDALVVLPIKDVHPSLGGLGFY